MSKENHWERVLAFLRELVFHSGNGGLEEEGDQMLVGSVDTYTLED